MPTFAVNRDIYTNAGKVGEVMQSSSLGMNGEWKGTAYLQLVDKEMSKRSMKKAKKRVNMGAYARVCETNAQLKRATRKETSVLTQEELAKGYSGVAELVAQYTDENIDTLLDEMDEEYYVGKFLEVRKEVYYEHGKDLWRVVLLAKTQDQKARKILQKVMEKCEIMQDVIEYVARNPKCIQRLGEKIC